MATVGNLCTEIIGDLRRVDASLSDIVLVDIQSSIREYETQRFYFNEQAISLTLSFTNTYALSLWAAAGTGVQDIVEIDFLNVLVNSTRTIQLEERTIKDLDLISGGTTSINGYPQFFSVFNQQLKIFPLAAASGYVSTMYAHVKFTEIAAGGFATSNPWTNDAAELIRNAALKRLWGRRFRDYDAAQACAQGERDALRALQRRTEGLSDQRLAAYL